MVHRCRSVFRWTVAVACGALPAGAFTLQHAHASSKQPIKVACVGASITKGLFTHTPYPEVLQDLLGSSYEVSNFGVCGKTALKNTKDKDYRLTEEYVKAHDLLPSIVIIQFGANDSKEQWWSSLSQNFEHDYLDLIESFRSLPSKPKVYVMAPPPLYSDGAYPDDTIHKGMDKHVMNEVLPEKYNAIAETAGLAAPINVFRNFSSVCSLDKVYKQMAPGLYHTGKVDAEELAARVLKSSVARQKNLNFPLAGCPLINDDGVHPTDMGAALIANVVYEALVPSSIVEPAPPKLEDRDVEPNADQTRAEEQSVLRAVAASFGVEV